MPRLFPARQASDVPVQWADDPKYQAALARLAAVQAELTERRNRLATDHGATLQGLDAELARAELEVLAGRGSEPKLADVQARHTAARVEQARDRLAVEDLEAEQRKLETETVPAARCKAKEAAIKSVRTLYRGYLTRIQAALAEAVEADAKLNALITDTEQQFRAADGNHFSDVDVDGFPRSAALWAVSRNLYSINTGGFVERRSVQGNTASFLDTIDKALDALDGDEATAAQNGTARKREQDGTIKQPSAEQRGLA